MCAGCGFVGMWWGSLGGWLGPCETFGLGGCGCMTRWPRGGWESHDVGGWVGVGIHRSCGAGSRMKGGHLAGVVLVE